MPVNALVLESVYPDFDAALGNRLRVGLGPLLGPVFTPLLLPAFRLLMPIVLGVHADELTPIKHIGAVTSPVLIASGALDSYTPLNEAEALFAHAPEPKLFWAVPGVGHADLEQHDPGQYWSRVLPFLQHSLQIQ